VGGYGLPGCSSVYNRFCIVITPSLKLPALIGGAFLLATSAFASESALLVDALIRKGILTNAEAEEIRAEVRREASKAPPEVVAGGRSTERLSLGMRLQLQYAHLDTDIRGLVDPAVTNHFFTRRIYLTLRAGVGGNWGANMTYDLAASGYDEANLEWRARPDLTFNFGLRKVNVAHEERSTSGDLRAIERSGVTRYFVEPNNGRRLGGASYRVGVFADGRVRLGEDHTFVYGAAITDPERNENFALASAFGHGGTNRLALWANAGLTGRLARGSWNLGAGAGFLPDQGGAGPTNPGQGFNLTMYSAHAELIAGQFRFLGEFLMADVEGGAAFGRTARPAGFFLQPMLLLTPRIEAVVRYQYLDTDGRGVQLSDVVRSAPAAPTMNTFSGWYAGANWYLRGNDLKCQLGLVYGKTEDTLTGTPAEATTMGVRSQMQIQF
jgi:hypothetical protein